MRVLFLLAVALLVAVIIETAFVVDQKEQVVITRFGEPVRQPITEPGLNFKLPLVEKIHRFDKRFLEWDGKVTEVQTKEKLLIQVDTYARWRISDPLLFLQSLQNEIRALGRIDGILNGATRDAVARYDLVELVRTTTEAEADADDTADAADAAGGEDGAPDAAEPAAAAGAPTGLLLPGLEVDEITKVLTIEYGRSHIREEILTGAKKELEQLGIELIDVQFKRINYTEAVRATVFERMKAERQRIADRFNSEGQGEALRIRGEKERDLKQIQSEAYRQAQEIVGRADAEAIEIYARAYDRSADSRAFYEFLKTMETYRATFDQDTWLLLSTDGDFFRFLEDSGG